MTDFYVYRLNAKDKENDRELGFVDDPNAFVSMYKPDSMEFTGVKVIAPDIESAMHVYSNPTSSLGEYTLADEPKATRAAKALFDLTNVVTQATLAMLVTKLGTINSDLNSTMIRIAKITYDHSNKMIPPEQIYAILKRKWATQFISETGFKDGQ